MADADKVDPADEPDTSATPNEPDEAVADPDESVTDDTEGDGDDSHDA